MPDISLKKLSAELDEYLLEAESLKYGDHHRLLTVAQQASHHAQILGDFGRYAQALTHQAWAYGNLNHYEASLVYALEVLQLVHEYGFVETEAWVIGVISLNFCRCGVSYEAGYLYEHQRKLGEQIQSNAIQAMALNDLAVLKLSSGDTETAIDLLQRAVVLMPSDLHQGIDRSIVHLNLSIAYIDSKQWDDAEEQAQQVIAHTVDAPKVLADAHLCLASIYLAREQLSEAAIEIQVARTGIESLLPIWYSDNLDQLTAELFMHEERYQEAAQVWEHMYTMTLQRQELDFAVNALNHLKNVYEHMNDPTGTFTVYKRLAEDIPKLQKQGNELRFAVLRTVFTLDKAALQAELKLNRQKYLILERLSHEFRTPLTIIQSAAEMVETYGEQLTFEQRQRRLRRITEQVQSMTMMLEDIVELLNLDESKNTPLQQMPFHLNALIQGLFLELDRYRIPRARIQIHKQQDIDNLYGSQKSIETILVHLITNAAKFSKADVSLDVSMEDHMLVMRVMDQGIGIPKEEQEVVFKPLVRGSNLGEVHGTGIGLAIVYKLVKQLHGSIDLISAEGKGTTITVRVPVLQ